MKIVFRTIVLFITVNHIFANPSPENDLETDNSSNTTLKNTENRFFSIQCAIGFAIDNVNSRCRPVWKLAGQAKKNENLTIICPIYYTFDIEKNFCTLNLAPAAVILGPLVCNAGEHLDENGICRKNSINDTETPTCIFGFELHPDDGECHLSINLAGKLEENDISLLVLCPPEYYYPGDGKLCLKLNRRRLMIAAPITCPPGEKPDRNGNCKPVF